MTNPTRKPLRLWPGVVIVILQLLIQYVVPRIWPDALIYGVFGALAGTVLVLLWWLFFSRAAWIERLGAVVVMVLALLVTRQLVDVSIATGAMGYLFPFLAIPGLGVALVLWAVATSRLSDGIRRATMVAAILIACGLWALVRTGGFTASNFHNDLHWRWTPTPEELLVAQARNNPAALPLVRTAAPAAAPYVSQPEVAAPAPAAAKTPEKQRVAHVGAPAAVPTTPAATESGPYWPGFRGPHRDDIVTGVRIKTDWTASPPAALWHRPVGPGWSSFAVEGDRIYTQEQRGPDEIVACYKLTTGEPVWAHARSRAVLGIERRPRSARHANSRQWPRVHIRRHRNRERARRARRRCGVVAQCRCRYGDEDATMGFRQLAVGDGRPGYRSHRRTVDRL